jgi:hypothetical protein
VGFLEETSGPRGLWLAIAVAAMAGLSGCDDGKKATAHAPVPQLSGPVVEVLGDSKGTVRLQLTALNQPRETNALVAYTVGQTPENRTGTNNHGFEVSVSEGRIIQSGGNNRLVPHQGFVLSAHGNWNRIAMKYGQPGWRARISADGRWVEVEADRREEMQALLKRAQMFAELARAGEASRLVADLPEGQWSEEHANLARETVELWEVRSLAKRFPPPAAERRMMIVRSRERTRQQVRDHVRRLKEAGFNEVAVEAFRWGMPVDRMEGFECSQMGGLLRNPVRVWREKGHASNLRVLAWVLGANLTLDGRMAQARPEWLLRNRAGTNSSKSELGLQWLDMRKPEVRDYILRAYLAIVHHTGVDGLALDYHRWPNTSSDDRDRWLGYDGDPQSGCEGTTTTCASLALNQFLLDLQAVTDLTTRPLERSMFFSGDLGNPQVAKAMNVPMWLRTGLVQNVMPVHYPATAGDYAKKVESILSHGFSGERFLGGTGSYSGSSEIDICRMIAETRRLKLAGYQYFEADTLTQRGRKYIAIMNGLAEF